MKQVSQIQSACFIHMEDDDDLKGTTTFTRNRSISAATYPDDFDNNFTGPICPRGRRPR